MFSSTKYFLKKIRSNSFKSFVIFPIILMSVTILVNQKSKNKFSTIVFPTDSSKPHNPLGDSSTYSKLCQVTDDVKKLRELRYTSHKNPARHVVQELLDIKMHNPNTCRAEWRRKHEKHLAIIIVDTARPNFHGRQLIRRTWASLKSYKGWSIRTVFLIGQSEICLNGETGNEYGDEWRAKVNRALIEEKMVLNEQKKHGDLVIGAFIDTYRNLTYKHLMGYKFVVEKCPTSELIIKTDDDMFVDVPAILDYRTSELRKPSSQKLYDLYCHKYLDQPTRTRKGAQGKWYSTREEWPEDTYPLYCLGNDYVISMEWLKKIYSVSGEGGFFRVDDVFIMGKLRTIAEMKYNTPTYMFDLRQNGKATDQRGSPDFVRKNCYKARANIGWFVFLQRTNKNFDKDMECLWKRALRNAKLTRVHY